MAAYVYASCGVWESTTDVVFGGHCLIAENGTLLAESRRFQRDDALLVADVDLDRLRADRIRTNSFGDAQLYVAPGRGVRARAVQLWRRAPRRRPTCAGTIDAHPFVPAGQEQLRERCEEIFQTQVAGLAKRLEHIGKPPVAIGVSGGLDSTLALLVACKTMDPLAVPRDAHPRLHHARLRHQQPHARQRPRPDAAPRRHRPRGRHSPAVPGRDARRWAISRSASPSTGSSVEELTERLRRLPADSRDDLVFENVQARMRTSLLMNTGFVIGTGDVSELALGWCTYNGDHMSMYNPNSSIPKTLVKFLVDWAARNEFDGEARRTLLDIVDTVISPELLPTGADGAVGAGDGGSRSAPTSCTISSCSTSCATAHRRKRSCSSPGTPRFDRAYAPEELRRWLQVFVRRFFANQFKRSCLPDGPKVGSISLSPRGDWRMPSDAQAALWLRWLREPARRRRRRHNPSVLSRQAPRTPQSARRESCAQRNAGLRLIRADAAADSKSA